MFLKKRRLKYQDFINNVEMETMPKPKNKPKVQALLNKINPPVEKNDKMKQEFIKPQTEDEWQKFHKINEDGMKKTYESKEGYYKDGNKLYIAGTRGMQDVLDRAKIQLGIFQKIKFIKI